ncbi:TRL-like family protein [Leptospira gomenensis]|uniref:TRL-like family protein n=2 Tax=Leptospira gomenensis TaxID=2484974 RepID=A0A5F1Y961_9LEPT|nr:TRL-like family protein [Leptospira gomenensis]TGK44219.1 TRL-like family protein [Leptospira gomenensis]TGK46255.1 TRL-like family protein [Leptospira gomenensis]TGK54779.1 TRL-like family protein [Leptospira gomenensis]
MRIRILEQAHPRITSLFLLLTIHFFGCTGVNIANSPNGPEDLNTNPTPAYGRPSLELFYKGGFIYHNESIPAFLGGNAQSLERGQACSRSILGLFAFGNSSINAARIQGNINKIAHVEYEHTAVLAWFYHSFCTIVTGESTSTTKVSGDTQETDPQAELIPSKKTGEIKAE